MMLILVSIFVSEFSIYPVGAETVVLPLPLDLREGLERQAQCMHTHDPIEPSVSIYTDKYTYHASDTMHLGLDIYNPLDDPVTVCVAIWLERPVSPIVVILHAHAVTLPAGFTYSNPNFKSFVLPSIPSGVYTWHAAFLNPATHAILVEDTAEWQFT